MKKWISILLALALCLPFSACGQEASSAPESGPSDRGNGAGPLFPRRRQPSCGTRERCRQIH